MFERCSFTLFYSCSFQFLFLCWHFLISLCRQTGEAPANVGVPAAPPAPVEVLKVADRSPQRKDETQASGSTDKDKSAARPKSGDLFSAHDFDIKIDLEVPLTAQPVVVTPKPVPNIKEAPRRSLNLEAYKKKRGLIWTDF